MVPPKTGTQWRCVATSPASAGEVCFVVPETTAAPLLEAHTPRASTTTTLGGQDAHAPGMARFVFKWNQHGSWFEVRTEAERNVP